jgi:hypothetical protein
MECKNCNKPTTMIGKRYKKYCNIVCQRDYENKISRKVYKEIECAICKKSFLPKSIVSKTCSYDCKKILDNKKRTNKPEFKNCKVCNKEFKPYTTLDKFCSANCRVENHKSGRTKRWSKESVERRKGVNNPAYVHGERSNQKFRSAEGLKKFKRNRAEYIQEMIDKHGYKFCERCNRSDSKLEAHHIVYRREKPNHENLHDKINITIVCVKCHNWYHNKKGNRNELVEKRELNKYFGNDILDK